MAKLDTEPKRSRAKISKEIAITAVTLQFADGHSESFTDEQDRMTLGLTVPGRPNALRPLDLLKYQLKQPGTTLQELITDEAVAQAAHFGQSTIHHSFHLNLDDAVKTGTPEVKAKSVISIDIAYSITLRRELDG